MEKTKTGKILTVSVAAYNAEEYLREVLDSFVGLSNINALEVFVVDDGGTDASLDIAKEYQERFPGVFFAVHKENGGWGSTVNYSIQHATGKYFRLLDGDDYFNKENLQQFITYLQNIDSDIIISPYVSFNDQDGSVVETVAADDSYEENREYILKDVKKRFPLAMHSITVRTSLLQENQIRLKEHCLYRDMEFTANILTLSETIMFYHRPIYYYRLGREGQSVSKLSYLKHIDEHADIVYTILEKSEDPKAIDKKKLLYNLAKGACVQQYIIYFYSRSIENAKRRLVTFDNKIKEYPIFYKALKLPKHISVLRDMNFFGYSLVMVLLTIKRRI